MKKIIVLLLCMMCTVYSQAQTACDSLDITVKYAAFNDSLIEISVINHGSGFYSYPGFVIFNTNGDTVAKEEVVLFGIGAASTHVLKIYPGMVTTPTFTGTLQLWSGFFSTMECSYNMNFNLCPDTCVQVYPYMINIGGAMSLGTVNWTIQDTASAIVASGSFIMDNTNQMDEDTVCLMPGNYSLHVSGLPTPMMGQPYFGITNHVMNSAGPQKHYMSMADQLAFPFYKKCPVATGISSVESNSGLKVFSHAGIVDICHTDGKPIGEVAIYSLTGQVVWNGNIGTSKRVIDLSSLAQGIYIVRVKNEGRMENRKVLLGN